MFVSVFVLLLSVVSAPLSKLYKAVQLLSPEKSLADGADGLKNVTTVVAQEKEANKKRGGENSGASIGAFYEDRHFNKRIVRV